MVAWARSFLRERLACRRFRSYRLANLIRALPRRIEHVVARVAPARTRAEERPSVSCCFAILPDENAEGTVTAAPALFENLEDALEEYGDDDADE